MRVIVDDEPGTLAVGTELGRAGVPDDVTSLQLRLHRFFILILFARMWRVRGGSVPLVGVDATVLVVQPLAGRFEFVRRHGMVVVVGRSVLALVTDQIVNFRLEGTVPAD